MKYPMLLTQVKLSYISVDCGMTYVLRLSDGRFVLIDSGYNEYEEKDHLFDILTGQNVLEGKPVIAAWFFTHAHDDHFGGFCGFYEAYGERVELQRVIYNFLIESPTSPPDEFYALLERIKDRTEIITVHSGEQYKFTDDAVFDMMFVGEDLLPEKIENLNDSSLVIRLDACGKRILFLGDAQKQASDYILKKYPVEEIKCDIVQVGHHGYGGGSDELYRIADPEMLLWPCPDYQYPIVSLWGSNYYLTHSKKIHSCLIAGHGEVTLDLSKPIEKITLENVKTGLIYEEDFKKDRVIELNWSFINGGNMIYRPGKLSLDNGAVIEAEEVMTACVLVQPWQTNGKKSLLFEISGEITDPPEKFGIMWKCATPTQFDPDQVTWLDTKKEKFTYVLKIHENNVELIKNGKTFLMPECGCVHGMHIMLQKGKVKITHVRLSDN